MTPARRMMILPAEMQEIPVRRASEEMMKTNKLDRIVKIILGILLDVYKRQALCVLT